MIQVVVNPGWIVAGGLTRAGATAGGFVPLALAPYSKLFLQPVGGSNPCLQDENLVS